MPIISTSAAGTVTATGALNEGSISCDGGSAVTARGVRWDTITNPTILNDHITDGNGTGDFTSTINGPQSFIWINMTMISDFFLQNYKGRILPG